MKKTIIVILTICLIFGSISTVAFASDDKVRVYVNGKMLSQYGRILDGNSIIPMRAFLEKIGFNVEWNSATNTVIATNGVVVMTVVPGTNQLVVNGTAKEMPCNAVAIDGVTYLPVRVIGESAGFEVRWLNATQSAILSNHEDAYKYYENTGSLLPEFGSVLNGPSYDSVSTEDYNDSLCYTYTNYTEENAYAYGDLLCESFGYEYDSMQLGESYSKIYTYKIGPVSTVMIVGKNGDVPYVCIYPDVNANTPPVVEPQSPEVNQPEGDNGYDSSHSSPHVKYYNGTNIPTLESVCGKQLLTQERLESGIMYVYEGSTFEMMDYLSALMELGFKQYDMQMGDMFEITYTFVKDNNYVIVTSSSFFRQIYVLPVKGN